MRHSHSPMSGPASANPAPTSRAPSLCASCAFMRPVQGRRGQRYLLCGNEAIDARYPPQPVGACAGYAPAGRSATP